ncbi:unnamed protein product [Sphagnum troendelagicum]|uniref:AP2/ERF domain-containing protein n=1 Tax=Sphagnum troendelagicum TaxID=128251 RepID=A0ABP0UYA1_9BRYO
MESDLYMVPNVDSGMQEDRVQLYFGQIPANAETLERFQRAFGLAPGSPLDFPAIHLQSRPEISRTDRALFLREAMMSEVTGPAYAWYPMDPAFHFAVPPHYGNDDDQGNNVNLGTTPLQGADPVNAKGRCMCEFCLKERMRFCPCEDCTQQRSMMAVNAGGPVSRYNREYPHQLSMVQENTGDAVSGREMEDVTHHDTPLSSVVYEAGTVAAVFQQLQLNDHGSESDFPANDDVGAQSTDVADVEPHKHPYLSASATKEEAARAYNKAALVLRGEGFQDRINFNPTQQYEDDVRRLKLLTNDQMALFLGGDSKGPGAVWTYPGVTKIRDAKSEATYGENWKRSPLGEIFGSYSNEEEAARAVYDKAVQENKDMTQMIKDTFFVRTLPFTAQQAAIGEWLAPHDDPPSYEPSDAGLPVPSAQKKAKRGRGKQKAPKKPYTPRKKKGAIVGPAPKTPREPYTPRKNDVVAAGVTAATIAEQKQTLQQNATMSENGIDHTDVPAASRSTASHQCVHLLAAHDDDDLHETSVTISWEQQVVDLHDVEPTPDFEVINPAPLILPWYVQADDPQQILGRLVVDGAGNNTPAPGADDLPNNSAATGRFEPAGVLIGGRPYLPFDPVLLQILRPLD